MTQELTHHARASRPTAMARRWGLWGLAACVVLLSALWAGTFAREARAVPVGPGPINIREDERFAKMLAEKMANKISFDFVDTPLQDVLGFVSSLVEITMVLDTEAVKDKHPTITLKVIDMPLGKALGRACKLVGMVHVAHDGALLVTTPARAKAIRRRDMLWLPHQRPPNKRFAKAVAKKARFDFVETPLQDVLSFIGSLLEITVVLDPQAVKGDAPTVTLKVNDVRRDRAARWVCRTVGLVYIWQDEAIFVATPKRAREMIQHDKERRPHQRPPTKKLGAVMAKKVSFDFVDTPLHNVLAFVSSLVDVTIVPHDQALKKAATVRLKVDDMPVGTSLKWICRMAGLVHVWQDGKILVTTPEAARKAVRKSK